MQQLSDATVMANNEAIAIVANTLSFTEGMAESTLRGASSGGGRVEQVSGVNLESGFSSLKFELPTTPANVALARSWKANNPRNLFQIAGSTDEGTLTRTFTQASVMNDYEVAIAAEGNIPIEIQANPAI